MKRSTYFPTSWWGQSTSEAFCSAVVEFVLRSDVRVPIFSEQLHALFGTSALRAFAARLGLQPRDLVRRLAQTLPQILNHLASQGPTPSAST
jgi:uncharacterized protein YidB (DUF937 family)